MVSYDSLSLKKLKQKARRCNIKTNISRRKITKTLRSISSSDSCKRSRKSVRRRKRRSSSRRRRTSRRRRSSRRRKTRRSSSRRRRKTRRSSSRRRRKTSSKRRRRRSSYRRRSYRRRSYYEPGYRYSLGAGPESGSSTSYTPITNTTTGKTTRESSTST